MHGLAVVNNSRRFLIALLVAVCLVLGGAASRASAQDGSVIGATICAPSSVITLDSPVSDSVVTESTVQLSGTIAQASQVEVQVDGVFDSTIQLTIGQSAYAGSVQLTAGTHTIMVTAVSICPGASGTASAVVTYEPPPYAPSTGEQTGTNVGGETTGGVTIDGSSVVTSQSEGGFRPLDTLMQPLRNLGGWLNLATGDVGQEGIATMPLTRAVTFTAGLYLVMIGLTPGVLQAAASLPAVIAVVPGITVSSRTRFLSVAIRMIGLLLIVGALFLP